MTPDPELCDCGEARCCCDMGVSTTTRRRRCETAAAEGRVAVVGRTHCAYCCWFSGSPIGFPGHSEYGGCAGAPWLPPPGSPPVVARPPRLFVGVGGATDCEGGAQIVCC